MYCPPRLHDATSKPHDLETLKQAWTSIYSKLPVGHAPIKISFTGGEVTANRNFLPFLQWLREQYSDVAMVQFSTNGSASLKHYLRLAQLVEGITFSTHSEYMDEASFFSKCRGLGAVMIRPQRSFHVAIMDEPWHQDRIQKYKDWLDQHSISYSINKIKMGMGNRDNVLRLGKRNLEQIL